MKSPNHYSLSDTNDMTPEATARQAARRAAMPGTVANLEEFRELFGEVKLTHSVEGCNRFGEPSPKGVVVNTPSKRVD